MICLIPARGGSKRVPRKNIRSFYNRPMISWAIESCLQSDLFDRIVVSTDDDEIAQVALQSGAEVPFRRPANLSDDHTVTRDVVFHAIQELGLENSPPQNLCVRYPTTPLLWTCDLRGGLALLEESGSDFVFAATWFGAPVEWALELESTGIGVRRVQPEHSNTRSQDLKAVFHDAGQFYMGSIDAYLSEKPIVGPNSLPYFIPGWRGVDIDSERDWQEAENLMGLCTV